MYTLAAKRVRARSRLLHTGDHIAASGGRRNVVVPPTLRPRCSSWLRLKYQYRRVEAVAANYIAAVAKYPFNNAIVQRRRAVSRGKMDREMDRGLEKRDPFAGLLV